MQVGDFNLSRYMALDTSYVQSSLELNPRWSAPEVIGSGHYSTAADVYRWVEDFRGSGLRHLGKFQKKTKALALDTLCEGCC